MTRINCVPPETLHAKHLVAEYRELPRIFACTFKSIERGEKRGYKSPEHYTLGTGHMRFFYDKLEFLRKRQRSLIDEMIIRGYNPSYKTDLYDEWADKIPREYWNDWEPRSVDIQLNEQRINERLSTMK